MSDPQELARLIKDTLHDRLDNSQREHLAFEAASLRAFIFSAIDSLEHIDTHVQHNDIHTKEQMSLCIRRLIARIENSIANLDDIRTELKQHHAEQQW